MIGGVDCEMRAPSGIDPSSRAVAVLRSCWPAGVFLDAEESEIVDLASPKIANRLPSREFFLYSDRATAETWEELGPCEENWNRMLHVLWDEQADADGLFTRVTVVVDEVTPDMQNILEVLQTAFNKSECLHREII